MSGASENNAQNPRIIGKWWRSYLFDTSSEATIRKFPLVHLKNMIFDTISCENEFKNAFFKIKVKATLSDYLDLNRRYIKTTDIVLFEDDTVKLNIVPQHFFKSVIQQLYSDIFNPIGIVTQKMQDGRYF